MWQLGIPISGNPIRGQRCTPISGGIPISGRTKHGRPKNVIHPNVHHVETLRKFSIEIRISIRHGRRTHRLHPFNILPNIIELTGLDVIYHCFQGSTPVHFPAKRNNGFGILFGGGHQGFDV